MGFKLLSIFLVVIMCFSSFACVLGVNTDMSVSNINKETDKKVADALKNGVKNQSKANNTTANTSTIYVSTYGDDNNKGTVDRPKKTIAAAVNAVSNNGNIIIASGQYNEDDVVINRSVNITGQDKDSTILDGFNINILTNNTVKIEKLNLINGNMKEGGAITNKGVLTVSNCIFRDNHGTSGGAINNGNILIVNDCSFSGNRADLAETCYGGAIFNSHGTCNITNSNFVNNFAVDDGGAIDNNRLCDLNVKNCVFSNNKAATAGAILSLVNCNCTVESCQFNDNIVSGNGGALFAMGPLNVTNTSFTRNYATFGDGGAIVSTGKGNICQSTFQENRANNCGGISIENGACNVTQNQFINNHANGLAGAVYNSDKSKAQIVENLFKNNYAVNGGGVASAGLCFIKNNEFNKNQASTGGAIYHTFKGNFTDANSEIFNNNFYCNKAMDCGGAITNYGSERLMNNYFTLNQITKADGYGGGLMNVNGTSYVDGGNDFFGNGANVNGGGITILDGSVTVQGSGNKFKDSAIYNLGSLNLVEGTMERNIDIEKSYLNNEHAKGYTRSPNFVVKESAHYIPAHLNTARYWHDAPSHLAGPNIAQGENGLVTVAATAWLSFGMFGCWWWDVYQPGIMLEYTVYNRDVHQKQYVYQVREWGKGAITSFVLPPGDYLILTQFCYSYNKHADFESAYTFNYITVP